MFKELNNKKSDFGLVEIKTVMDALAENYLKSIINFNSINQTVSSIKNFTSLDVQNINKLDTKFSSKY